MKLVSLLHLRTEYPPEKWAMYYTLGSLCVFEGGMFLPYNSSCVQMFGDDHGRTVDFDPVYHHKWAIMSFPQALTTLRAQLAISDVLCRVVDTIVADASPSGNSKWLNLVPNQLLTSSGETRWSLYEHPAFVEPYGFDTKPLLDKVTIRFNELVDNMELVQTDPEYMLNYALTFKASMRFKDPIPKMAKWNLVAASTVVTLSARLFNWARVVDAYQVVHTVFEKHRLNIIPGITLPPEVGNAMWMFSMFTGEAAQIHATLSDLRPLNTSKSSDCILATALGVQKSVQANHMGCTRKDIQLFLGKLRTIKYEKETDEISSIALLDEMRLAQTFSQLGPFEASSEGILMSIGAQAMDESLEPAFSPAQPDTKQMVDASITFHKRADD
jgi:hypothetical protein